MIEVINKMASSIQSDAVALTTLLIIVLIVCVVVCLFFSREGEIEVLREEIEKLREEVWQLKQCSHDHHGSRSSVL